MNPEVGERQCSLDGGEILTKVRFYECFAPAWSEAIEYGSSDMLRASHVKTLRKVD